MSRRTCSPPSPPRCAALPVRAETQTSAGTRLHVFGYASDLEWAEILYTSLLVQMARALAREPVPAAGNGAKAWRRSWLCRRLIWGLESSVRDGR